MSDKKMKYLDKEEEKLIRSIEETNEWQPVSKKEKNRLSKIFTSASVKKDARLNIRLPKQDIDAIKTIAETEGMPYQTMIASVLHKVATGKIKTLIVEE